jgi:hypothetical protein
MGWLFFCSLNCKMKRIFKFWAITGGIIMFLIFFFYAPLFFMLFDNPFNNKRFDTAVWIHSHDNNDEDNLRGEMYKDLVKNHLSKGMSKKDVIELLGDPDYEAEGYVLNYYLGFLGFGIDPSFLRLEFDKNGKLLKFYKEET